MFFNFKDFLTNEALRDNLILLNTDNEEDDIYQYFKDLKDKPFENNARLLRYFKGIKLIWYNKKTHDIIKRVRERTRSFDMVHFNDMVYKSFEQVDLSELEDYTMYALYLKERNISILFRTKKFSEIKELFIKTILLGDPPKDAITFNINDEYIL